MTSFRADLHCHTTCSDGTLSPLELVDQAISNGLSGLSITDHDTVEAYTEALPYSKEKGFPLVSGVEFSCIYRGVSIHILGYAFTLSSSHLLSFCQRHKSRRERRLLAILDRLRQHHMPIEETELFRIPRSIGRPHIALAMMQKGYVSSVEEAFKNYLGEGQPCYVPGDAFTVDESLDVIHQAKGFAIIAHPHLIKETSVVKDLLSMPFDGLEGYYALFSPPQEERWIKIAKHRNWLITGGSDFHGSVKPQIFLGCSWVAEETFNILKQRFSQNDVP